MSNIVPMQDMERMASALAAGKMFGKTAAELLPLMLIAQAEGKHPAIAAQEYDIIQGRPALNSRSALARFQAAGGKIQWQSRSDTECSATFSHPQGGELTITWTINRAKQAGLTGKDNWRKFPAQMLSARVIAEGVRACFPASLSGFYTTEEVQDFEPPRRQQPTLVECQVVEPEQIGDDDTAKKLDACTTLDELQAAWKEIPVSDRRKYTDVKDSVKARLMEVAA